MRARRWKEEKVAGKGSFFLKEKEGKEDKHSPVCCAMAFSLEGLVALVISRSEASSLGNCWQQLPDTSHLECLKPVYGS